MDKAILAKTLRYKKPMLADMGFADMTDGLWQIQECCSTAKWEFRENRNALMTAFGDDEEELWGFEFAFGQLESKAEDLQSQLYNLSMLDDNIEQTYNDCTVALIGNRYNVVGFDTVEEDYYSLTSYQEDLAQTEAGKRLMRKTKADMISTIGQCIGILLAWQDLKAQESQLSGALSVLQGANGTLLELIKAVNSAYDEAAENDFLDTRKLDRLCDELPPITWLG